MLLISLQSTHILYFISKTFLKSQIIHNTQTFNPLLSTHVTNYDKFFSTPGPNSKAVCHGVPKIVLSQYSIHKIAQLNNPEAIMIGSLVFETRKLKIEESSIRWSLVS